MLEFSKIMKTAGTASHSSIIFRLALIGNYPRRSEVDRSTCQQLCWQENERTQTRLGAPSKTTRKTADSPVKPQKN